jgi:hypothetical protein
MWILVLIGVGIVALAHTAPAPFVLDAIAGDRAVWHMRRGAPPTVYLTYDDGPNPTTTPDLLDVLAREAQRPFSSSIVTSLKKRRPSSAHVCRGSRGCASFGDQRLHADVSLRAGSNAGRRRRSH